MDKLIFSVVFLVVFLNFLLLIKKWQQKENERKNALISNHLKNIAHVKDTLDSLKDIPVSTKTISILLNRWLDFANTINQQAPNNAKYSLLCEEAKVRIETLGESQINSSLPKANSEHHMIFMIKTIKRTIAILKQEIKRKESMQMVIRNEILDAEFFAVYLTATHYIKMAEAALRDKVYGTARDRFEEAIKTLELAHHEVEREWRRDSIKYCRESLAHISKEMGELNERNSVSKDPTRDDDTGLSRMLDLKKQKIASY